MKQEHEDFLIHMTYHFGPQAIAHAIRLMRLARRAQRYNVLACNAELSERQQRTAERIDDEAQNIAEKLGTTLQASGDPRGFALKIIFPDGAHNTWAGTQGAWGVPSL